MTLANKITLFRIISIPFFVACLVFYTPDKPLLKYLGLSIFLVAIISDIVDGYIARSLREKTRAGAILDPLADKALLITAFIFLYQASQMYWKIHLPLWVLLTVVSRDIIILTGSGLLLAMNRNVEINPTWWGKLTTFFQMATVVAIVLENSLAPMIWKLAAVFTFISGVDYARKGINLLEQKTCSSKP